MENSEAILVKDVTEETLANIHSYSEAQQPDPDDNDTKRPLDANANENTETTARRLNNNNDSNNNGDHSDRSPLPQRSLDQPDLEDTSLNFVFHYVEQYEEDLSFSFLSDFFFLCGGIGYTILSLVDLCWSTSTTSYGDDEGIDGDEQRHVLLRILEGVAPTIYILNSMVDVEWARRVRKRIKAESTTPGVWDDQRKALSVTVSASFATGDAETNFPILPWTYRARKHSTHRRDLSAALSFGFAASLGFFAVLYGDERRMGKSLDVVSVLMYIVSALFAITGNRARPWLHKEHQDQSIMNDAELLEDMGDLLFLVGSLIDGLFCGFQLEDAPIWELVSSLLWVLDSLLYLRADYDRLRGVAVSDAREQLV
jgi:hypothetical protein